jgi:hypothetical protein
MQNMAKAERERKVAELKKFGATFKVSPQNYHVQQNRTTELTTTYRSIRSLELKVLKLNLPLRGDR